MGAEDIPVHPDQKEAFDLKALLAYENPHREEYDRLIQKAEKDAKKMRDTSAASEYTDDAYDTSFSTQWPNLTREEPTRNYFREHLNEGVLVHLGGRLHPTAYLPNLKLEAVVNVDRYAFSDDIPVDPYVSVRDHDPDKERVDLHIKADILDFISRVNSDSVSVVIDGIDGNIIDDPEYHKALASEIYRVTKEKGLVFGINSGALAFLREEKGMKVSPEVEEIDKRLYAILGGILEKDDSV